MNKFIGMGRFTDTPELKTTQKGTPVTTFTLAIRRKDATDWIDCVAWQGAAEFITKYFQKGSLAAVVGSLHTRTYEDRDGSKRKSYEVSIEQIDFCEPKKKEDDTGDIPF